MSENPFAVQMRKRYARRALVASFVGIAFALLLLLVLLVGGGRESSGETLYVDDDAADGGDGSEGSPFKGIQDAIDASEDGDTVRVREGVYYEHVVMNKSISLVGAGMDKTTIDGSGSGTIVRIRSNHVNVTGFLITGSSLTLISSTENKGMFLESSSHVNVFDNNISGNAHGIAISAHNCTISNNIITDNSYGLLVYSRDVMIRGNNCSDNAKDGIYVKSVLGCTIIDNICDDNRNGISLYHDSSYAFLHNNSCSGNSEAGVYLSSSATHHTLSGNLFEGTGIAPDMGFPGDQTIDNLGTHTIDDSNTMNGRRIHYYVAQSDISITDSPGEVLLVDCQDISLENDAGIQFGIIAARCSNLMIRNMSITNKGDRAAIYVFDSNDCAFFDVECTSNEIGIYLEKCTDVEIMYSNISWNSVDGIRLVECGRVFVENNSLIENGRSSICISRGEEIHAFNNRMKEGGFYLRREYHSLGEPGSFEVGSSNVVNGRPVVFYINRVGETVPSGAGQIILTGCSDMIVKNQNCSDVAQGIFIYDSSNVTVRNNSCDSNTVHGMVCEEVVNSAIVNNSCTDVSGAGIYLYTCSNMLIDNNSVTGSEGGLYGDFLYSSDVSRNDCSDNSGSGIYLKAPNENRIAHNTCARNDRSGMYLGCSTYHASTETASNNVIEGNTIILNGEHGLYFGNADDNVISANNLSANLEDGVRMLNSDHVSIINNRICNNTRGLLLPSQTETVLDSNEICNNSEIGIQLSMISLVHIRNNTVASNHIGISVFQTADTNTIRDNIIADNVKYGIDASENSGPDIDATGNWWGHDSGPYHSGGNPFGMGNSVTGNIIYDPWHGKERYFIRYVDPSAPHGGNGTRAAPFNNIQDAVDDAPEGGTVHVWEGVYFENVKINKILSLIGNGSDMTKIDAMGQHGIDVLSNFSIVMGFHVTNGSRGINVGGNHNQIIGNNCSGNLNGIHSGEENRHTWQPAQFRENVVSNNTCFGNEGHGIALFGITAFLVDENNCSYNEETGIVAVGTGSTISNNTCSGNWKGISGNLSDSTVVGNDCELCDGTALDITGTNVSITGNSLRESMNGLFIGTSSYMVFTDNYVSENTAGIVVDRTGSFRNNSAFNNMIVGNDRGVDYHPMVDYDWQVPDNETINVSMNYWGADSGPYNPFLNPEGEGNSIAKGFVFWPWLNENDTINSSSLDYPLEEPEGEETKNHDNSISSEDLLLFFIVHKV